ncbi:hypothetical protein D9601_09065 [Sphingomonas sp. MA1305]|uniref:DUF6445 family protein n=1 Tax=Sphingomonas sp. MA1305 TaxID=2479204 RepID=UPI0018E02EC8|nr:DUF6445 family protein [Sphingomonas sp. MA1305]MBI0475498.1 hypothetical protein [Sphingomonas sp. MA1305]
MTASITVTHHGAERQPVVVFDDFADAEMLRDDAGFLSFAPIGEHYPGVRARVAPAILRPMLATIAPVVADVFGIAATEVVDAFYSLVTTPPARLAPIQRLPHFDEVSPNRLALLHFLSPDESSGTAFYRQRSTGFESVDAARLPAYRAALDADLARHGLPDASYIAGDTPVFDQLAVHRGRFNRAILYRSNTLHCAFIPPDMALSDDPLSGRLTVNTFLDAAG